MSRILILGGYGYTGKPLARHLLEQSDAEIVLAGRSLEKAHSRADELNQRYPGGRVSAACMDAADQHSLRQALGGIDLLLVAAPVTHHTVGIARAALD